MKLWRPSPPAAISLLAMVCLTIALVLSCTGCAVDQGVEAELVRKLPDGTEITGKFSRKWAGGPVELEAEVDPATGKFMVRWSSDVDLDPAARASVAQAEAQAQLFRAITQLIPLATAAATGIPPLPKLSPTLPAPTPSRAELGGKGPPAEDSSKPKIEIDQAALEDLDDEGGP